MLIWTETFRIHRFANTNVEKQMTALETMVCVYAGILFWNNYLCAKESTSAIARRGLFLLAAAGLCDFLTEQPMHVGAVARGVMPFQKILDFWQQEVHHISQCIGVLRS